jgi:hypothetical protein
MMNTPLNTKKKKRMNFSPDGAALDCGERIL